MAANIPAKVKQADLTKFIVRAAQLELAKPVVAYWCEYWIVNQILAKGLHQEDNETMNYTLTLMDKLEKVKAENATNDAIMDDVAGQAYVEQFGLETFQRADRAVKANKVTKQTADTFLAAATFLELVNIWSPPEADTQSQIKYAKWNAVRIMKAVKEGKDPNDSNPKEPEAEEEGLPPLDPNDPEVQGFGGALSRQPSFVEVPDEQDVVDRRMARQSSIDQSLHPSAQVSARASPAPFDPYPKNGFPYTAVQDDNVSPLEPSPPNERNGSVGGGYFPEVPTFTSESQPGAHPTAPPNDLLDLPQQPSFAPVERSPDINRFSPPPPQDFYHQAGPPPPQQPHQQPYQSPPQDYVPSPSSITYKRAAGQLAFSPPPMPSAPVSHPTHSQPPPPAPYNHPKKLNTDDASIAKAQKHARFAISALNFEDAETAVKELRAALQTLGAS